MRLTKEQADENRGHILETATQLFCRYGFNAVSVAQLMRTAGFTHGGFYNHFVSKQALAAEACSRVFARAQAELSRALRGGTEQAWGLYAAELLSAERVDTPSSVCSLATLATDASRAGPELQALFAQGINALLETLRAHLGNGDARMLAIQRLSELVGAWVLAQAVARADPELSNEVRSAHRARWRSGPLRNQRVGRGRRARLQAGRR